MSDLRSVFDLACPACGQAQRLYISVTAVAELTRHGSEVLGGHEWSNSSACSCPDCGHRGTIEEFTP